MIEIIEDLEVTTVYEYNNYYRLMEILKVIACQVLARNSRHNNYGEFHFGIEYLSVIDVNDK